MSLHYTSGVVQSISGCIHLCLAAAWNLICDNSLAAGATGIIVYNRLPADPKLFTIALPEGTVAGATFVTAVDGAALLRLYFKGSNVTATFNNDEPVSHLTEHGLYDKALPFVKYVLLICDSKCVIHNNSSRLAYVTAYTAPI